MPNNEKKEDLVLELKDVYYDGPWFEKFKPEMEEVDYFNLKLQKPKTHKYLAMSSGFYGHVPELGSVFAFKNPPIFLDAKDTYKIEGIANSTEASTENDSVIIAYVGVKSGKAKDSVVEY